MFICSTILYFNETPVGYDLHKTNEGFELKPTPSTKSNLLPPAIFVLASETGWQVNGVQDDDIRQQAIRLIEMTEVIDLRGDLSAAS